MRVVICDEESLEPITVVNLPGLTDRCLDERRHWRVAIPQMGGELRADTQDTSFSKSIRYVDLEFERISRVTLRHGEQLTWLCLTRASELAMLLTPDWLPGQRPVIQQLQDENERLSDLMSQVFSVDF